MVSRILIPGICLSLLIMYQTMRINTNMTFLTFVLGAFIFYAIGLPLIMTKVWIAGFGMVFISLVLFFFIIVHQVQTNKYIYLAFNMEDSMEDMFEIKRTDVMNLRRKWKKIK